ncbi:hypothetical protein BaRGS_00024394 [Batillaria attramentaria]|uniref:F-box domain-containing protein n=1 Tax=Batillaria attramentaria TaxID=370345 RepID=A0ABD0KB88_9CAEN
MSAMSATSTTTLKTDVTSKVLPGDKSGLPLEIWQIIFSFLSVRDLCRVARVSKTWYELALSIDMTRWKELYLSCGEWKHPFWPMNVRADPPSWKNAYRDQYLSTRFWIQGTRLAQMAGCMSLLKRNRERQTIEVGPGLEHQTLKSALAVANDYDKILVHPGIYDEQLEMSLKSPFELVGAGELGSVILVVCLEQVALTGRLSNLVLRAPWFTNFVLKVRSGYLQVDSCIVEDGMMYVQNPGTCHVRFCTFRHATIILQHVNSSIVRNCEFSQSDNANVIVEGYPKEEKGWSYHHLCQETEAAFHERRPLSRKNLLKITESTTSTLHSTFTGKSFTASTVKTYDTMSRGRAGSHVGAESVSMRKSFDGNSRGVNSGNVYTRGFNSGSMYTHGGNSSHVNGHEVYFTSHHDPTMNAADIREHGVHGGSVYAHGFHGTGGSYGHSVTNSGFAKHRKCTRCQQEYTISNGDTCKEGCVLSRTQQFHCGACASASKDSEVLGRRRSSTNPDHIKTAEGRREDDAKLHQPQAEEDHWLEINDETQEWHAARSKGVHERSRESQDLDLKKQEETVSDAKKTGPAASAEFPSRERSKSFDVSKNQNHLCEKFARDAPTSSNDCAKPDCPEESAPTLVDAVPKSGAQCSDCNGVLDSAERNNAGNPPQFDQSSSSVSQENDAKTVALPDLPQELLSPDVSQGCATCCTDQAADETFLISREAEEGAVGGAKDDGADRRSRGSYHSSRRGSSSSDDDLSILDELESGGSSGGGSNHGNNSSSSSDEDSDVEGFYHADHMYDCSDGEESVIMLPHLRQKHLEASLSANAVSADVGSICSQTTRPITFSASQDEGVLSYVNKVRGCLIHQCRMIHSKGGVMVSLQGHALVSECDISNVSYGIRCIQNSRVLVLKNRIHHCRTSGIFMRLAASGLITGNDIHSNNEAGIDIRKSADPIIQYNRVHHGKRSGIVVLGSGRGQIRNNDIFSNTEAGIYILYGGNPTVSENHIYDGRAAGVAVNEGGRGFIFDNTISGNQWGGVDIRRGSCPMVCRNTITNGLGDGIVIGDQGQGTIENNVISDNAGCGVWLMSASRPYIHGNQISNNGDTGVMMVNKTDIQHEGSHLLPAGSDSTDPMARSVSALDSLDGDVPTPRPKCSHTTVQHNNIYHNAGRGVAVELGDTVDIMFNAIYANQHDGLWVNQDAPVSLCGNSISSNRGCGVIIAQASCMQVAGNGIYDNRDCGIHCHSNADIMENDVVGNHTGGIILESKHSNKVVGNRIQSTAGPAVRVGPMVAASTVTDNIIHDCGGGDIVDISQRAIVKDNEISRPTIVQESDATPSRRVSRESLFNKSHFLYDPPARPAIEPPPPPSALPAHNISTVTKVMVPSGDTCQEGSKLCGIL